MENHLHLCLCSQVVYLQIDGFEDLALRKSFTEKSDHYRHKFSHQQSINVKCPVTILHGVKDQTVPFTVNIGNYTSIV